MIDWLAFGAVAVATFVATVLVIILYSLGIKLLSVPAVGTVAEAGAARDEETDDVEMNGRPLWATILANACFTLCGIAVLYGIYLIVPALHR
ncbi:hypothetical protein [Homoserinimonas sp. OAct 916]|uniref:hypothetical protein n=1 Tax=Homoserinimonas sp. OAct 916 TaxID=2211450 RepID=UPI000DBE8AE7|nr:hypothetical protein [Homoserinimonas sp. OAct 916]